MSYNNKKMSCPSGYHWRKGYTRKFKSAVKETGFTVRRKGTVYTAHPTSVPITVGASCVKNRRSYSNMSISKLRKGDLVKYGYQYRLSDRLRHAALRRAMKVYGALNVYRKLDAVAKLSVTVAPDAALIFSKDRDWVHDQYV
jgi:hypothetical protein